MSTTLATPAEKRAVPRRRVMKSAKIAFGDFIFVRDCALRDVTSTGARVVVGGAHEVPNEFHLVFPSERRMRKVRVAWRREGEMGVVYEGEPVSVADGDPRLKQFTFG